MEDKSLDAREEEVGRTGAWWRREEKYYRQEQIGDNRKKITQDNRSEKETRREAGRITGVWKQEDLQSGQQERGGDKRRKVVVKSGVEERAGQGEESWSKEKMRNVRDKSFQSDNKPLGFLVNKIWI